MASLEANTAGTPHLVRSADKMTVLAECPEFRITRHRLALGEGLDFEAGEQARIVSVVSGSLAADGITLGLGDNALLPYAGACHFVSGRDTVVLVTDNFSSLDK
jgi:mannose-6-phosphate isomerase